MPPEQEISEHLEWVCLQGGMKQDNCRSNGHIQEQWERTSGKTEVLSAHGLGGISRKAIRDLEGGTAACWKRQGRERFCVFISSVGPRH